MANPSGQVLVDRTDHGKVAVVTLQNPPVNVWTEKVIAEAFGVFGTIKADPSIIGAVFTANGSAGADLKGGILPALGDKDASATLSQRGTTLFRFMGEKLGKPIVGALGRSAFGGGTESFLHLPYRIGVPGIKIGLPEVTLGLICGYGGLVLLPRVMHTHLRKAIEHLLSGKAFTAEQALEYGFFDHLVSPDQLVETAIESVKRIADGDLTPREIPNGPFELTDDDFPASGEAAQPAAHEILRKTLLAISGAKVIQGFQIERTAFAEALATADARIGVEAFVEKTTPQFTGK